MAPLPDRVLAHLRGLAASDRDGESTGEPTDVHFVTPLICVAGRFDVVDRLGEGGMGTVYRAHDRATGRRVALKILHLGDASAEQRFDREIRALAALAHPGIVGYVAHGGASGGDPPFVAMELLEGETLAARLSRGALTAAEAIHVGLHVASALSAAHAIGLVHRDVKPQNVVLCRDGVKLVDFGLARRVHDEAPITRDGYAAGTLGYMAPEQLRGDRDVDARADVFALGCLLHDALVGPARRRGVRELIAPRRPVRDERPDAPEALEAILLDMLAPSPAVRLPHAGAVLVRLLALQRFVDFDVLRAEPGHGWIARSFGRRAALHGRDAERAWLAERIATPGFGCLVVGEPGVGKTRLALDVVDASWTVVAADPGRAAEPLAFLARLVGAVVGIGPGDRGADRERRARRAVLDALPDSAAAEAIGRLVRAPSSAPPDACVAAFLAWTARAWPRDPWRLVLDDLEDADAASLDVLAAALARGQAEARPRIVALARASIFARHPGIAARLGLIPVGLRGLGAAALDAMAEEIAGVGGAARLGATRALGSPLHAEEELRALELGLLAPSPDTVEARIALRIAALSPYARWALRAASLFGGAFVEADLTAALGQRDPAAARRALVELALFDLIAPLPDGAFRVRRRLDAEVARALAPPSEVAIGARAIERLLETSPSAAPLDP